MDAWTKEAHLGILSGICLRETVPFASLSDPTHFLLASATLTLTDISALVLVTPLWLAGA